ncbi:conserved Plasmodium protein, unknown function [Plasmodium chabaudi chabaudi]|uniref:Uncharacterized protein n=1 Tax=Plasmodium chabaudi chabaudi TaxID=31271 RepID=A0A4V0K395_PLACU|nr:conserved Plasmodium protein, unknown function [Plasmodium chabaudi chabaudi]VTZ67358.1 conserved Plasmodium protein, unknown function [Plasmodium chabaudi chabaudi]|eukprot:XP_016655139.1 conserved Plasmodium protein, unknown function [Plasmodium chabaudi chabaudi]
MFSINIYFKKCLGVESKVRYQKWCRCYSTGEYSSSVSRIFNNINNKLKKNNNKSIEYEKCDKVAIKDIKDIYRQYESIIKKINFSKMMGRDLSYCMNILSKINYFKEHIFWLKCANRLTKGFMIHRINTQSYYIISNALSKGTVLYDRGMSIGDVEVKEESEIKNLVEGPKFCRINFDGTVKLNRERDKTDLNKKSNSNIKRYHKIYDEISIRFLYDVKRMNIDEISCILNLFSKLNLNEYNLLSYYFSDYFVMTFLKDKLNFEKYTQVCLNKEKRDINTPSKQNNKMCYSETSREDIEKIKNICYIEKYDISKLIIILHSLVNSHVTHVEFLYICCYYFNKNFEYLNNIDICNILYSFGKNSDWLLKKKYKKYIFLKRITDKQYVSYIRNIVDGIKQYEKFYNSNNNKCVDDNLCNIEKLYFNNEQIDNGNLSYFINKICEKGEIYYSSLLTKILKHIQKEKVLNKFSCIQISSIVLSLIKLKINSLNIFHSFNYKVIEMWKEFSLRCIADYLYSKYEINLSNDYVLFLLFYKFVHIIFHKYMEEFEKLYSKHGKLKQNKEGIYFLQTNYKKIKILNTRDCLLIVRIFQSFCKGDTKNSSLKNQDFKTCYDHLYCLEYALMLCQSKEKERQLKGSAIIGKNFNISDGKNNRNNKEECFWSELESSNNSSIPLLDNFDKKYETVKRLAFRTLCLSLFQHLDIFPFEYKCLISYFSINISDYFYLGNYEGNGKKINDHLSFYENENPKKCEDYNYCINKNTKMDHCHKVKIPSFEVSNLCMSFSSRMLFHVLNEMKYETLNEVTLRQIYTCILCLYLNIINIWDLAKIKLKNEKQKYLLLLGNVILQDYCKNDLKYLDLCKKNINTILMKTEGIPNYTIFHFISLNILKKIALFLDHALEKNYQQNEISITSKMHNDISSFLKIFISNMNEKRQKKIKQRNEVIVGPFVLDCILE